MNMNSKVVVTQIKRELWENKVSFVNTPLIISLLVLALALGMTLYMTKFSHGTIADFHYSFVNSADNTQLQTPPPVEVVDQSKNEPKKFNVITSVASDPTAFNGFILGVMYTNCVLLFLIFSIVLGTYSLRCLFDDRKNRDILFWRSMPVSETTNVLVKLTMLLLVVPIIILILNFIVTVITFFAGLIFLGFSGIGLSYLLSSAVKGGSFYIPFQIFYELIFSLLMLMPVIGFAFFASAFARKTPFFTFASPLVLVLADKIFNAVFGINIGVIDMFAVYGRAINNTKAAFILQQSFVFHSSMILPLVVCIGIGALFIGCAIWMRNNRYEI